MQEEYLDLYNNCSDIKNKVINTSSIQKMQDKNDLEDLRTILKIKDEEIKNLQGSLQTYEIILKTNLEVYTNENYKQRKIINHLSRKIQNKNKKYRQLQARKMPPTMFGREVIIVPDSIADKIMVANKEFFDIGSDINNGIK